MDLRTQKTRRAIQNALVKLLSQKELNKITVTDVAAMAEINRKSFYNNYDSIHQVIDDIENEVVEDVKDALMGVCYENALKKPSIIFERLTAVINKNIDFYGYLLRSDSNYNLSSKIIELLKDNTKSELELGLEMESDYINLMLDFALSGMFKVYREWFLSSYKKSIDEVSEAVSVICFSGINRMMKKYQKAT